ncbi:hypothetical protein ONZ45_g10330 [Pleurotus djamor]|nr:hypothetical protein ONZ45_g10330 [Pleurotus djamor]
MDSIKRDSALQEADQTLLQSALSDAFSPPPLAVNPTESPSPSAKPEPEAKPPTGESEASPEDSEAWKAEYEAQVNSWREQSASAREQAEKERARWEAIRAAEKNDTIVRGSEPKQPLSDVQPPGLSATSSSESPGPADARDLVAISGETAPPPVPPSSSSDIAHLSTTSHADNVEKWEDIPSSLTSSFPSMSFPEHTEPSSPARKPRTEHVETAAPPSATLSVFDSSLSSRTRIKALLSSLAINLALPFVNGVMLGFGEIFAKNVILEWFGWNKPSRSGRVATTAGLGVKRPFDAKK